MNWRPAHANPSRENFCCWRRRRWGWLALYGLVLLAAGCYVLFIRVLKLPIALWPAFFA